MGDGAATLDKTRDRDSRRGLRKTAQGLYRGHTRRAQLFLYGLLLFDTASLLFIIVTSFLPRSNAIRALDVMFGAAFLAEFLFRLAASRHMVRELFRVTTWTDVAVIASLLLSASGEAAGFLRALRTLTLLRTFRVVRL